MSQIAKLTIVTVAGPGDEALVLRNIEYIHRKNPDASYHIHVLDNGRFHGFPELELKLPNVTVHTGEPSDYRKPDACRGSYQHATALNRFLREQEIDTRYLMILDPDFYVVRDNWITDALQHMAEAGLWFMGVPWHPKWYSKHRYFPCVHCMFVDLSVIKPNELDFTPDLIVRGQKADRRNGVAKEFEKKSITAGNGEVVFVPRNWMPVLWEIVRSALQELCHCYAEARQPIPRGLKLTIRAVQHATKIKSRMRAVAVRMVGMTLNRRIIGAANDTGYLVEKLYASQRERLEIMPPSVSLERDFSKPEFLTKAWGRKIESLVPDRWSYIPKMPGYFTEMRFKSFGLPNTTKLGWEEFFWGNLPWGVHMRRYNKSNRDVNAETVLLNDLLGR